MKIAGKTIPKPQIEVVVIPRSTGDLIFKAAPILDYGDFLKLCPQPLPPKIMQKGGTQAFDVEDKQYKAAISDWAEQRTNWMIIKSLQATEGLEWETVDLSASSTWKNFNKEFEDSGLTAVEVNAVVTAVIDACGLNQKKIEDATKAFLAGQVATLEKQ